MAKNSLQPSLESITRPQKDRYLFQYVVSVSATTCMFITGIAGGWNSPSIPKLVADDSPIPMTMDEGSWLITVAVFGVLLTIYPTVWCARRNGPKRTLLLCIIPFFIGWLLIAVATTVPMLFVARFFFGCAYGITYTLMPGYLSEIASDRVRGSMMTLSTIMVKLGFLFCFALAPFISIRTMALVAMVPCALFGATFVWMPDSPFHLIAHGRPERAAASLMRLRGHRNIAAETELIEMAVHEAANQRSGSCMELLAADQRRGLIICVATSLVVPLCGSSTINNYSQIIFTKINWHISAVYASILLATVQLGSAMVGHLSIDWIGRRPLLLGSCATMGVCTAVVGVYFGIEQRLQWDVQSVGWLPMVALMVFQFAFSVGLEPVAATLLGELFPKHLKALGMAVCQIVMTMADVSIGKLFQVVSDGWGNDVSFGALVLFSWGYLVFAALCVPETKGRRMCDILAEMKK